MERKWKVSGNVGSSVFRRGKRVGRKMISVDDGGERVRILHLSGGAEEGEADVKTSF